MSSRRNALGKGLSALLGAPEVKVVPDPVKSPPPPAKEALKSETPAKQEEAKEKTGDILYVSIEDITPNPMQPRTTFSQESLEELAASIRNHGVLQPILITRQQTGPGYYLVAGERRFRAAQKARLKQIPAILQEFSDEEMLEIAIVENVQRDDLNVVDEAKGYRRLADSFGWSQEQIAARVGKSRSAITNSLRLLRLGDDALKDLEDGRITPGHARAILAIDDTFYRKKLRQEIIDKGMSVREAERQSIVYQKSDGPTKPRRIKSRDKGVENVDSLALEERLMTHLGCRVKIRARSGNSGTIEIPYENLDELDRFLQSVGLEE